MQKPSVDIAITTDLVEAFLKCPTKCFLLARAEVATGNAYADWVRTKSEVFRSEGITRLVAGIEPDKCATSTAATECGRSAQWQLALDFTAGRENLRCSFDAVGLRHGAKVISFPGGEKRLQVLDKRTRKPPRLEVQNAKGETLTADDLELVTA